MQVNYNPKINNPNNIQKDYGLFNCSRTTLRSVMAGRVKGRKRVVQPCITGRLGSGGRRAQIVERGTVCKSVTCTEHELVSIALCITVASFPNSIKLAVRSSGLDLHMYRGVMAQIVVGYELLFSEAWAVAACKPLTSSQNAARLGCCVVMTTVMCIAVIHPLQ